MKKMRYTYSILFVLLVLAILLAICWGSYAMSPMDVVRTLLGNGTKLQHITIFTLRLPRMMVALLVGVALSTAGGLLQTITKNDLADSGILGINAGAALAAVVFISFQGDSYYQALGSLSIFVLPFVAMLGALLAALLIYKLAYRRGIQPQRLLLIGIGVNIAITALISFYSFKGSAQDYNRILVWTSGSLWGSSWSYAFAIAPMILFICYLVYREHRKMDVMVLGDEVAIGLGVDIEKERKKLLLYAVLLAGCATAVAGSISFLGLLAPHIAKKLVGPRHKQFLFVSALLSSMLILVADSFSRNIFSPLEIPVGITISLIGVPYFIYLMMKEA